MTIVETLPRAVKPFVAFAHALRANGFAVAPEQTQSFIAGVGLLGLGGMEDIHRAAVATLAPPPERREEFDALFRMIFLGQSIAASAASADEDEEFQAFDDRAGAMEPPEADEVRETGAEATLTERLTLRSFGEAGQDAVLRDLRRHAATRLPKRRSRRLRRARSGERFDMRRALREAAHRDGEVVSLPQLARKHRQRRILLLIDVSGSMKELTDGHLRFAHALMRSAERAEVFTLGTRLTRISRALRHANADQALATAATMVADWDGGTRLGDALQAFLSVPRFAGFARGALVVVVSDGLERGSPDALVEAMARLSRLAWSVLWLTPLAAGRDFAPQTEGLVAAAPYIDSFGSAASVSELCAEVLGYARRAA